MVGPSFRFEETRSVLPEADTLPGGTVGLPARNLQGKVPLVLPEHVSAFSGVTQPGTSPYPFHSSSWRRAPPFSKVGDQVQQVETQKRSDNLTLARR